MIGSNVIQYTPCSPYPNSIMDVSEFQNVERPVAQGERPRPCNHITFSHNGLEFAANIEIDGGRRTDREELKNKLLDILCEALKSR